MPSKRRRFLRIFPMVAVGSTGCSSLQPNGREDDRTSTPDSRGGLQYEPTTPAETDSRTPYEEPEYVLQTPVTVAGRNVRSASYTVGVTLEIRPESEDDFREVRNRTYEFRPDESVEIGEFEAAGAYRLRVDVAGESYEETLAVPMRDLADCNHPRIEIHLHDAEVTIGYTRTDAGCPPVTVTPTPDEA